MGKRGTEVARQAADLVLADDDLATVVAAAEEGRRVYANIRRFLLYALSGGPPKSSSCSPGRSSASPCRLLPAQILWINLLTHGLPGVALGASRPIRPPCTGHHGHTESVLGAGLWLRIAGVGSVIAAVTLGIGVWAHDHRTPWQTMIFVALTSLQLGVAMGLRPRQLALDNPTFLASIGVSLLLAVAGVYLSPLQTLLGTESLLAADLLLAIGIGIVGWVVVRLTRQPGRA